MDVARYERFDKADASIYEMQRIERSKAWPTSLFLFLEFSVFIDARVFKLQCRAIERVLKIHSQLVFIEPPFEAWPARSQSSIQSICADSTLATHIRCRTSWEERALFTALHAAIEDENGASGD